MELEKTVIQAKPVTLSLADEEEIIRFIQDNWNKGKQARKKYIEESDECKNAYECYMPPIESPELDWMSNICLPWAYDSTESWFAHIHSTTIPKNDQVFTISGRTEEDHPGAEIMQKYLEFCFERNQYSRQLGRLEKELGIRNHACGKVYWKQESTIEYNWVDEPVVQTVIDEASGMPMDIQTGTKRTRQPQERVTFNNVWIDVVELDNFVMFPIHGDFEKTTKIEEIYRFYEDFMASAKDGKNNYFNLDQITLDDEVQAEGIRDERTNKDGSKCQNKGLKIKEAWIHRIKLGDKVYRNYVATLVNDKVLVRFQPFPVGCPKSPYIFMALRPDGNCFYGYGLNSKGLGLLNAANKKFNGWIDEGVLTQHNAHKYYDDGVFNPNNVVRRPGAMVKMSQQSVQDNLIPIIDDLNKQQQAMADLAALKVEFETVTVPKVVKGMIEVGRDATATEINQAQNNSSGKMHIDAYNINDFIIQPTLEMTYQAIYDRAQFDETIVQEIQTVTQPKDPKTGMPLQELPILPLPQVDIKVVGYQNVIRKQEALQNMNAAIPQLAQSPVGKYLNWVNIGEDTFTLMDLDRDRYIMDKEQRQQIDQQQQAEVQKQQDLLIQQEVTKLELQKQKQEQDFAIKQQELELKRQQIECDCQAKQQQLNQQAVQAEQQHQEKVSENQQKETEMGDILQERIDRVMTDANQIADTLKVQGDTNNRYQRRSSGLMEFGSGTATPDLTLGRNSAGLLGISGGFAQGATTESTAASTLANYGVSVLNSSGAVDYTLAAPVAGVWKSIVVTGATTLIKSVTSNGATMGSTANNKASIDNAGGSLHLLGMSTSMWAIVGKSTFCTMSTA